MWKGEEDWSFLLMGHNLSVAHGFLDSDPKFLICGFCFGKSRSELAKILGIGWERNLARLSILVLILNIILVMANHHDRVCLGVRLHNPVGGRLRILVLLPSEDINGSPVNLGMAVLSSLGNRYASNLARKLPLHDDQVALLQFASLNRVRQGAHDIITDLAHG